MTEQKIPISEVLQALLDDATVFHPRYILRLSNISRKEAAQLQETWSQISRERRQNLMEVLLDFGAEDEALDFEAVCRLALVDEDPHVRLLALRILADYEAVDLLPDFMEMLLKDPDVEVRAAAATNLGAFIYLGEIEELPVSTLRQVEECLLEVHRGQDDKLVRRRALEALGFSGRKEISSLIEAAYTSEDLEWLISALFAMGRSYSPEWGAKIIPMLKHDQAAVRSEAATAAGELGLQAAVKTMILMLGDEDADVRSAVIWALSEIGGSEAGPALENLLEGTEDEDELDLIETALENLAFNDEFQMLSMMDSGDTEEDEEEWEEFEDWEDDDDEDDWDDDDRD